MNVRVFRYHMSGNQRDTHWVNATIYNQIAKHESICQFLGQQFKTVNINVVFLTMNGGHTVLAELKGRVMAML